MEGRVFLFLYSGDGETRAQASMRAAMVRAGVACHTSAFQIAPGYTVPRPKTMKRVFRKFPGVTDTFSVNWPSEALCVPPGVRHHRWIQDHGWPFPCGYRPKERHGDINWVMCRGWVDGRHRLLQPAIEIPDHYKTKRRFDFGYFGFIPDDLSTRYVGWDRVQKIKFAVLKDRNFISTTERISEIVGAAPLDIGNPSMPTIQREILCFLQRFTLIFSLKDQLDIAFWGQHCPLDLRWNYRGHLQGMDNLYHAHTEVRVALNINGDTHVHGRTLEALAMGLPVVSEYVPGQEGELEEAGLAPFVRVGKGIEGFREQCELALVDKDFDPAGARQAVMDRHTWDHRAKQVLEAV